MEIFLYIPYMEHFRYGTVDLSLTITQVEQSNPFKGLELDKKRYR